MYCVVFTQINQGKEKERNSDGVPAIFVTFFFMHLSAVRFSYPSHFPASAFSASILFICLS